MALSSAGRDGGRRTPRSDPFPHRRSGEATPREPLQLDVGSEPPLTCIVADPAVSTKAMRPEDSWESLGLLFFPPRRGATRMSQVTDPARYEVSTRCGRVHAAMAER